MNHPLLRPEFRSIGVAAGASAQVDVRADGSPVGARSPVQVAGARAHVHDEVTMADRVRDAIILACEQAGGIDTAWMSDDGSEFVVAGPVSAYAGCKLAAKISAQVTEVVGGVRGPWIEGLFLPRLGATRSGLREIWHRQAEAK